MIVNTLKKCCYICNYPEIETEKHEYIGEKANVYIYCIHDKVCKYYNESEEERLNQCHFKG